MLRRRTGQFQFCAHKNPPIFRAKKQDRIKLLNELPAISFKPTVGPSPYENHPIFKKLKISPTHKYFYESNNSSIKLLSLTNGWAFLSDLIIKKNSSTLKRITLNEEFDAPVRVSLIKSKNRKYFPLFDLLAEGLRKDF